MKRILKVPLSLIFNKMHGFSKVSAALIFPAILVSGCEREHPPVISEITCSPDTRNAGTIFTFKVFATDEDGDPLTWFWRADEGEFTTLVNFQEVKWKSPVNGSGREFTITAEVSDGVKLATGTYKILLGNPLVGSIAGLVNYTNFTIPVPGVTISIGGKTTETDSTGRFLLTGVPAIKDTLFAAKQDFSPVNALVDVSPDDTAGITLEMTSVVYSSKVLGTVTDQDGVVLQNVRLSVLNPDSSASKVKATTNEIGFYQLWYIPFGERTILASREADSDFSYGSLTVKVTLDEMQEQLNLVLKKTPFNGEFPDPRDGNIYAYRTYGGQVWMTENLAWMPEVSPPGDLSTREARYYVYSYKGTDTADAGSTANYRNYGVLYNWTALKTACPSGWHAPTWLEWNQLVYFLGSDAGKKMKSSTGWSNHGNGTNSSGFNAWPGGQVDNDGEFTGEGIAAYFWTTTYASYLTPWITGLRSDSDELSDIRGGEKMGFSIRCIRNN